MAEVRCGAKVEAGEEIVIGGGGGRTLPGSETATPKLRKELGVGCGGAIGCGGELIEILERLAHNIVTCHSAVEPD
ncbi:methyltransferase domain-containing protein [Babesia caballi]|uniref:Methyltransferase domain-containing protein n=1 Tax=Babesia caballi TaxID=5871 RepID=A0AAV4LZW6_BABCB|nr:methyltransferase domain-containing protein [Babesia caballi]